MWRKFLAAVFILLMLTVVALLFGTEELAHAVATRALDAANLTLHYEDLNIEPLQGKFVVSNLYVIRRSAQAPLLKMGSASLSVEPWKFLFGDNSGGKLIAQDIDFYLPPDDQEEKPEAIRHGDWLAYRDLLPGTARVENLNLHWKGENPDAVTRIASFHIEPDKNNTGESSLEVSLVHGGADASIRGTIDRVSHRGDGLSSIHIKANIGSHLYQLTTSAEGSVVGKGEQLKYQLAVSAETPDIQACFRGRGVDFDLNGRTRIDGILKGDAAGFSMTVNKVSLDYMPEYRFDGAGQFDYTFGGATRLDLKMEGELAKTGHLIAWLGIDVSELGSAKASTRVVGSLDDLMLRNLVVTTQNDQGLVIGLSGNIRVNNLSNESPGGDRGIDVTVSAPNFSALQAFTGKTDFETGPWKLSAHVREDKGKLKIRNIDLSARGTHEVGLAVEGEIGDASSLLQGDIANIQGIALRAKLSTPASANLTRLVDAQLRELGPVAASAEIQGSGSNLLVTGLDVATGKDGLFLEVKDGSLQMSLAPTFTYAGLRFPTTIELDKSSRLSQWLDRAVPDLGRLRASLTLQQTAQGFGLDSLRAELSEGENIIASTAGSLQNISPPEGVQLETNLNGLPTSSLFEAIAKQAKPVEAGHLYGRYRMAGNLDSFEITELDLENRDSEQLRFLLKGALQGSSARVNANLHLELEITDRAMLQELTGYELGAMKAKVDIHGSNQSVYLEGDTRFGESDLDARLLFTLGEEGLSDIKGSITSRHVQLADLGLGQIMQPAGEPGAVQQPETTGWSGRKHKKLPLEHLPRYPVDLILASAKLDGKYFSAEDFSVHVRTGGGLYELKNLHVKYSSGRTRLNAALDTRTDLPGWNINAQLHDFRIEHLRDLGAPNNMKGNANTIFHLDTQGDTPAQMLEQLDGEVAVALEDISLKGAAYDRLAVDTLAWFYTGGVLQDETQFSCLMGHFKVTDGIVASDFLYAESEYLVAGGKASVDLPAGKVNVAITPRSKRRAFQIPGTIRITGPLEDPRISTSPISQTIDTSAQVILLAPSVAMKMFNRTVSLFDNDRGKAGEPGKKGCPAGPTN